MSVGLAGSATMRTTRGGAGAGAACAGVAGCWAGAAGAASAARPNAVMLTNRGMRITFMELYSLSQGDRFTAASRVLQSARLRDIYMAFTARRWTPSPLLSGLRVRFS